MDAQSIATKPSTPPVFGKKVFLIALALSLGSPLYWRLASAPVFFLQVTVIAIALSAYVINHRRLRFTLLDQLVLLYLGWTVVSYLVNFPVLLSEGRAHLLANQAVSLANMFFIAAPFLLGRSLFQDDQDLEDFMRWSTRSFALVLIIIGVFFILSLSDLYMARRVVAQRIPMMLTFLAWAICAAGFWRVRGGRFALALWFAAIVVVLLSLTRAAYLQWVVSAIAFAAIGLHRGWISWRRTMLFSSLLAIGGSAILLSWKSETGEANVIIARAEQLITVRETLSGDESASGRTEIWRRLALNLRQEPFHLFFGYGQLGPSPYMGGTFISLSGEYVDAYNAHNQHLDTAVRAGIIGVVLEMVIFFMVLIRPLRDRKVQVRFFHAHSAALCGVFVYGMFHETLRWQMFGLYFWLYAGIVSQRFFQKNDHIHV